MAKKKSKNIKYGSANKNGRSNREEEMKEKKLKNLKYIYAVVAIACVLASLISLVSVVFTKQMKIYTVEMKVKDFGTMKLELYEAIAPITVDNFVNYVEDEFYDGLTFHRIIEGFMIQGGDPTGTGFGSSSLKTIKGEFKLNGWDKNYSLKFEEGVIGMARGNDYNSGTSQFFICLDKYNGNGSYASFGKVVEGIEVLRKIGSVSVYENASGENSVPVEKVYIDTVRVIDVVDDESSNPNTRIYTLVIPFAAGAIIATLAYVLLKKKFSR